MTHYGVRIPDEYDGQKVTVRARLLWRKFDRKYTEFAFYNNRKGFKAFEDVPDLPITEIARSEIELAVIIGKRGKYISPENAFDHIAGYAVINDFSFRDRRSLSEDPNSARLHWFTLKNLDNAVPIGPWLVSKDEIPDPYALDITLTLDNEPELRQSGSTEGMMHRIEDLVMHASNGVTLEPGDVIATGTPHDVAFGQQRFLKDGDILRAGITGIGDLVNPIRSE